MAFFNGNALSEGGFASVRDDFKVLVVKMGSHVVKNGVHVVKISRDVVKISIDVVKSEKGWHTYAKKPTAPFQAFTVKKYVGEYN